MTCSLVWEENIKQEKQCFRLKDLAVDGKDLINIGIPEGTQVGLILKTLLNMVIDEKVVNDKDILLIVAKDVSGFNHSIIYTNYRRILSYK